MMFALKNNNRLGQTFLVRAVVGRAPTTSSKKPLVTTSSVNASNWDSSILHHRCFSVARSVSFPRHYHQKERLSILQDKKSFSTMTVHPPKKLSAEERADAISTKLDKGWTDVEGDRDAIYRKFEFENFQQSWQFMTEIAKFADTMDHHPEWFNVYNRVEVTLTTHDCNGLSIKDITLAETMDDCANKILNPPKEQTLTFQPTCDLYDQYLDEARVPNCNVNFQNLGGKKQFCGIATTVKCFEDNSKIKELLEQTNGKGKILMVDGGGKSSRCALLGDMIAKAAMNNQWEGIVVFGYVRDVEELCQLKDLGIMALGSTPRKSCRRNEGQIDLPIQIDNVWCKTGDKVYVDDNGVLIV